MRFCMMKAQAILTTRQCAKAAPSRQAATRRLCRLHETDCERAGNDRAVCGIASTAHKREQAVQHPAPPIPSSPGCCYIAPRDLSLRCGHVGRIEDLQGRAGPLYGAAGCKAHD